MKKLWILPPIVLTITLAIATLDTKRGHQPGVTSPTTQSHTSASQTDTLDHYVIAAPYSKDLHSKPDQTGKPTDEPSSVKTDITMMVDDKSYRYEGDALYPYLSWQEKMKLYFHGRDRGAVRYPEGLNFQGIQQLSDNVYAIDQQELDQQAKQQDLLSQAKIDDDHGSPAFSEVVPGGVFDRLGIISGDQITSLNGTDVHNYVDLYDAYQCIQGKNEITLSILRNGHPIKFTYFIQ